MSPDCNASWFSTRTPQRAQPDVEHCTGVRDHPPRRRGRDLGEGRGIPLNATCVGGFDVLACPRCGGRLRSIALIEEAAVIGRILRHLGVPAEIPAPRPARAPPLSAGLPIKLVGTTIPQCSRPVPFLSWLWRGPFRGRIADRPSDRVTEGRQVVLHRVPERFQINAVVLMPQPIADAADLWPRRTGAQPRRVILQPNCCLADHEQLPLDQIGRASCRERVSYSV